MSEGRKLSAAADDGLTVIDNYCDVLLMMQQQQDRPDADRAATVAAINTLRDLLRTDYLSRKPTT